MKGTKEIIRDLQNMALEQAEKVTKTEWVGMNHEAEKLNAVCLALKTVSESLHIRTQ